jgi:glutaminyl-tRNA synthetase
VADEFGGTYNLRFDDTNPSREEDLYVRSILEDIKWLGYDWEDRLFFASDYFETLYEYAVQLVRAGKAYICDLSADEIREYRGTLTEPGQNSPYRDRSIEENLDLLTRMRNGEFPDGTRVLRAKIDMSAGNLNLRDPVMYRILHMDHHRTGDAWCIYPTYDWAHGQSDSIEGITHSLCDIGFEDHRPLYNWFLENLDVHHPRQIEFARLNLSYTVLSKRRLRKMVEEKIVDGWDDPRMPSLSGLRRRGYTSEAIRAFCRTIGVAKRASIVDIALLEHILRDELNSHSPRVMAVLRPLKLVIENYPEGKTEYFEAENNPEDPSTGTRPLPFGRELYIERTDFREDPPRKFFRLAPDREVRLKFAYIIRCTDVIKDPHTGEITELRCTYDPETRGGATPDGRRIKGTLHWVSAEHAKPAEVRLYDRLFSVENPMDTTEGKTFLDYINPDSLEILENCFVEPGLSESSHLDRFQFLRHGYFCVDTESPRNGKLVFNRTVALRDSWAKIEKGRK